MEDRRLGRLEILGAWLGVWTPPRGAAVPPVPWRLIAAARPLLASRCSPSRRCSCPGSSTTATGPATAPARPPSGATRRRSGHRRPRAAPAHRPRRRRPGRRRPGRAPHARPHGAARRRPATRSGATPRAAATAASAGSTASRSRAARHRARRSATSRGPRPSTSASRSRRASTRARASAGVIGIPFRLVARLRRGPLRVLPRRPAVGPRPPRPPAAGGLPALSARHAQSIITNASPPVLEPFVGPM